MVEIVFARVADDFAYRSSMDCDVEGLPPPPFLQDYYETGPKPNVLPLSTG